VSHREPRTAMSKSQESLDTRAPPLLPFPHSYDADHPRPPGRERAGECVHGWPFPAAAAGPADSHGGICDL